MMPPSTIPRSTKLERADIVFKVKKDLLDRMLKLGDLRAEHHSNCLAEITIELKEAYEEALTCDYDLSCRYNSAKLRAPS